jgi:hypothetical protein
MSRILPQAVLGAMLLAVALPASPVVTEQAHRLRPERSRQRLDIVVRPGDRIRLDAGGCFRSGTGPPEPLLGGRPGEPQELIFIPGVTMAFAPVAELLGRDLVVSPGLDFPTEPRIWLDWGPWYRSSLEGREASPAPQPCESAAAPHLEIRIRRGGPPAPPPPGSLTLDLNRYDVNLLPFNPTWAGGKAVDACATCDGFGLLAREDGSFWLPAVRSTRCTLQSPYVDAGECRPRPNECTSDPTDRRLSGHINWGPATYTGFVSTLNGGPVHIAYDGDAGLYLKPDGGAGLTRQRPDAKWAGVIGLEFSTPETVMWFRTAWWRRFPFRRFNYRPIRSVLTKLHRHDGGSKESDPAFHDLPATVVGIFGLDTVHEFHSELHPIYGIAIRTEIDSTGEVWQVFARSWGTEGDCGGQNDHRLATRRIAIPLPAAGPGSWRGAEGTFFEHGLEFRDWKVYGGGATPTIVVELPDRPCSVVEGQLTLRRQGGALDAEHFLEEAAPVGEPIRLDVVPGRSQLCVKQPWFRPVD